MGKSTTHAPLDDSQRTPVAVAAIARELVGFIWAAMTRRESARQAA